MYQLLLGRLDGLSGHQCPGAGGIDSAHGGIHHGRMPVAHSIGDDHFLVGAYPSVSISLLSNVLGVDSDGAPHLLFHSVRKDVDASPPDQWTAAAD